MIVIMTYAALGNIAIALGEMDLSSFCMQYDAEWDFVMNNGPAYIIKFNTEEGYTQFLLTHGEYLK